MTLTKTSEEIKLLREGGKRLARVLTLIAASVKPGIAILELDALAEKLIREEGDEPAFLKYQPEGAPRPYPASLCVSVDDEIVHGIPTKNNRILEEGSLVGLDLGLTHKGMIVDSAVTVSVGSTDEKGKELMRVAKEALVAGIAAAQEGNTVGDIGAAIESMVKPHGFGIPVELGGHGVGYHVHEEPFIPNFGKPGAGLTLVSGMVLALEPMVNEGTGNIIVDSDGYTVRTADGKRSAHFEHTIVITKGEAEVLTK